MTKFTKPSAECRVLKHWPVHLCLPCFLFHHSWLHLSHPPPLPGPVFYTVYCYSLLLVGVQQTSSLGLPVFRPPVAAGSATAGSVLTGARHSALYSRTPESGQQTGSAAAERVSYNTTPRWRTCLPNMSFNVADKLFTSVVVQGAFIGEKWKESDLE